MESLRSENDQLKQPMNDQLKQPMNDQLKQLMEEAELEGLWKEGVRYLRSAPPMAHSDMAWIVWWESTRWGFRKE